MSGEERPAPPRIVGVFAHPDDESFAAGGLLARAARLGWRVEFVCATAGEGAAAEASPAERAALASRRLGELAAAAAVLGAAPPRCLGLPDGALADHTDALDAALADLLAPTPPDVLVGYGPDGGYGHRDHVALCRRLRAAVLALPEAHRPALLEAHFPPGHLTPFGRRLRRARPTLVEASALAPAPRAEPTLVLDLGPDGATKRAALACHGSQLPAAGVDAFLGPGILAPLLTHEAYTLAPGTGDPRGLLGGLR